MAYRIKIRVASSVIYSLRVFRVMRGDATDDVTGRQWNYTEVIVIQLYCYIDDEIARWSVVYLNIKIIYVQFIDGRWGNDMISWNTPIADIYVWKGLCKET